MEDEIIDTFVADGITQFRIMFLNDKWTAKARSSAAAPWTVTRGHGSPSEAIVALRAAISPVTRASF